MKKNLYLVNSGILKREQNTLMLQTRKSKEYYPIEQIDTIHIYGEITINKRLLQYLNHYSISIMYYNYYGQYIGSYIPAHRRKGNIITTQVQSYLNMETRNYIVKEFLDTQIHNELSLLQYYHKKGFLVNDLIVTIKEIKASFQKIETDNNYVKNAMLAEARIKQIYYQIFDRILKDSAFQFQHRSTYPPHNEINACMSFGYALLYNDMLNAILQSPLAPEISYVHSISKHGNSLQFDMADMLKSVYIDRLIIRLIRRKQITKKHFILKEGCFLNEEGKRIFIKEYEIFMQKTILDTRNKKYYSYRQLLKRECYLLIAYISGRKEYKGYKMRW